MTGCKKITAVTGLIVSILLSACGSPVMTQTAQAPAETVSPTESRTIAADSVNTSLYTTIVKEGNKDFLISPYSLKDAFSILYPAADGLARTEIESIFGFCDGTTACRDIDDAMLYDGKTGIKAVNKAYINTKGLAPEVLHPEVLDADLFEITEFNDQTYKDVNRFVEENTNHRIKNLIMPADITEKTKSVLVNCLYFLKSWDHKDQNVVWKPTGETIRAFGDDASLYDVKEDGKIDILRICYDKTDINSETEHEYAMYILCDAKDSKENDVDRYLKNMTDKQLADILDFDSYKGLKNYDSVYWTVPCFEMEYRRALKGDLLSLGMSECFDSDTDGFRRFAPVYISEVIQKCFIRADETGTEAAAATAILMDKCESESFLPMKPKYVVADHDFAFVIKDETAKEILFMGRVGNPSYDGK